MNKANVMVFLALLAAISAALVFGPVPAGAQSNAFTVYDGMQVYVRNKPLTTFVVTNGQLYAPASDFLRLLKFGATQGADGIVHISSDPGAIDTIKPGGGALTFEYNGATFQVPYTLGRQGINIDVRRMCNNLGAAFIYSKETGIIDITVPQGMSAKQYQTEHTQARIKGNAAESSAGPSTFGSGKPADAGPTASGTADSLKKPVDGAGPTSTSSNKALDKGPKETPTTATAGQAKQGTTGQQVATTPAAGKDTKPEEEPITQVGALGGFADDRTGQCYWTVTVKNGGKIAVSNVILTLHIADGTGKDYATQIKPVGNMNPGDTSKVEFYWQGMKDLIVFPKVEIKHDPLPKDESKPATPAPVKKQPATK